MDCWLAFSLYHHKADWSGGMIFQKLRSVFHTDKCSPQWIYVFRGYKNSIRSSWKCFALLPIQETEMRCIWPEWKKTRRQRWCSHCQIGKGLYRAGQRMEEVQGTVLSVTGQAEWEMFRQGVTLSFLLRAGVAVKEAQSSFQQFTLATFILNQFPTHPCPSGSKKWGRTACMRYLFRNKSRKLYPKLRLLSLFSESFGVKFLFASSFQQISSPRSQQTPKHLSLLTLTVLSKEICSVRGFDRLSALALNGSLYLHKWNTNIYLRLCCIFHDWREDYAACFLYFGGGEVEWSHGLPRGPETCSALH